MKRMMALLLAAAICLGCVACAGGSVPADTTAAGEETVLTVVTSYGGDDGNRTNFVAAVKTYEEHSGVVVLDNSADSNEAWKTKVLTDFMTGSEPDVLFYFTNADADPFINAGKVVSIEEIRQVYPDYATNMKESMMAAASDGLHYAVPSTGFWETMFANKTVLDACGIEVPGPDYTWEQFLADCETIKTAGYTPIACSLYEIPHYWFEFAVMNNGTPENHLEVPALDADGNLADDAVSRKWIAALEDMKYLYDAGYFPDNTLTATDAETAAMFGNGEAAFMIDGSWKVGYFTREYPEQVDQFVVCFVPGKAERQANDAIGGISMGYFITRKAWDDPEMREAAVEFVFHMTSEEILSMFVTTEVTALVNGAVPTGLNTIQQSAADAIMELDTVVGAVQDAISGEAKRDLFANIQKVMTGQMDAKDAVESAIRLNGM